MAETQAEHRRTKSKDHGHITIYDGGKELGSLHYQSTVPLSPGCRCGPCNGRTDGKVADRLRDDLKNARHFLGWALGEPPFVPLDQLTHIVNQSAVSDLLRELREPSRPKNMNDADIQDLSSRICCATDSSSRYCCRRLVATLLESNMENFIPDVVGMGFTDKYLPPVVDPTSDYGKEQQGKLNTLYKLLKFNSRLKNEFRRTANKYNVPFFTRSEKHVNHYEFHCTTLLPFTSQTVAVASEESHEAGGSTADGQGGFSRVWCTKIHASHHNFSGYGTLTQRNTFAIKELHAKDHETFEAEINALIRFSHENDVQLVKLLATYEVKRNDKTNYYLIFPWANGSVRSLWKQVPDIPAKNPKSKMYNLAWIGNQALAIIKALMYLHEDYAKKYDPPDNLDPEKWGRHGDIKAANFLVYRDPEGREGPRIFLADFGLARFSRQKTRSDQAPRLASPSYRPPEFDLEEGRLSRKSDIWSLGAFFLEFLTWYLKGWEAVNSEFPESREELEAPGVTSDIFFSIKKIKKTDGSFESKVAVKQTVLDWISLLHENEACSHFVHDLLDIIENDMLVVIPSKRTSASDLAKKLESMVAKGDDYLKKRRAYTRKRRRRE